MKIERETIKHISYESRMNGVGKFKGAFKFYRETPRLKANAAITKASLCAGLMPVTREDNIFMDTLTALTVYVKKLDEKGAEVKDATWIDEVEDIEILYHIHSEWLKYQNSFYQLEEVGSDNSPAVQG